MTQGNNEVLTREDKCISLISGTRTATHEDYSTITERGIPVRMTEQTWILEVGRQIRVGRTIPRLVDALVKIKKWLNHTGSGKIDDGLLEARHNIRHNFRINGIRL